MKAYITFVIIFLSFSVSLKAQDINKKYYDPKVKSYVLIGECNLEGLKEAYSEDSFHQFYNEYKVNDSIVNQIRIDKELSVIMIIGTWCNDCNALAPQFVKVLHALNFSEDRITIVGISTDRNTNNYSLKGMDIKKVPTMIIKRKNKEIGRIIENPLFSFEEHLSDILNQ